MPLKRFTSMDRWLTPGLRDCVETQFAASPPDVRKGSALPARADGIWGYAPSLGHSPGLIGTNFGGAEPPPHIRRHSRDRSFHTVAFAPRFGYVACVARTAGIQQPVLT